MSPRFSSAKETGSDLKKYKNLGFSFFVLFLSSSISWGAGSVCTVTGSVHRSRTGGEGNRAGGVGGQAAKSMQMVLSGTSVEPVCRVLVYNAEITAGGHTELSSLRGGGLELGEA